MNIDRHCVIQRFTAYVQKFDHTDAGVVLKYEHSMRVSRIIEDIARGISLSDGDVNLAWCIGVLHDIGRFEQLREYHTFIDYRSVDHAKYGAAHIGCCHGTGPKDADYPYRRQKDPHGFLCRRTLPIF